MDLNVKDRAKLTKAVEGRKSDQGFIFAQMADYKSLIDAELVEADQTNKSGRNVAIRATDKGISALNGDEPKQPEGDPTGETGDGETGEGEAVAQSAYELEDDIAIPAIQRRAEGSKYPFDAMKIGQSFHVPKTAEMPNPVKSLASSVSAANINYATKLEGMHKTRRGGSVQNYRLERKFVVRPAAKDDPKGPGARVWRVELPKNPVVDGTSKAS